MLSLQDKSSKIRDYIFRKEKDGAGRWDKEEVKLHNNYVDIPVQPEKNKQ